MHRDQVDIGPATARSLLDEQFPHWSGLSLRPLATSGTVHTIFRLGESLAVRFPLLPVSREVLQSEADAALELAAVSTVPAPMPVALGEPGHGYPLPWSVQTWLPGRDALHEDPAASLAFADDLAGLIAALRQADTRGRRFTGDGRGGSLPDHDVWIEECLVRSEQLLDVARLRSVWSHLRELPQVDADVMTHGDLTPANLLVDDGRLAGVLDTGGFAAADPALDLVSVWHLLDEPGRLRVRKALGCSDVQWGRGMAWAFQQAMGLVWYYDRTNPEMARWGRRTLDRLLEASVGVDAVAGLE